MYDIIIYAALATIVCVVFYSVLGKNVGMGPDAPFDPNEILNKVGDNVVSLDANKDFAGQAPTGLNAIVQRDPSFSPADFINGAKAAYSMILEAFASGDREQLGELLTDDVYAVYETAINDREVKNYRQVTDLGRLRKTSIQSAELIGSLAKISVLYEAELTSALFDEDGELVQGDPEILSSISEVWDYERDLKSSDPNWRLASVEPSEGEALEADPTPDTKPAKKKPASKKPSKPASKKPPKPKA